MSVTVQKHSRVCENFFFTALKTPCALSEALLKSNDQMEQNRKLKTFFPLRVRAELSSLSRRKQKRDISRHAARQCQTSYPPARASPPRPSQIYTRARTPIFYTGVNMFVYDLILYLMFVHKMNGAKEKLTASNSFSAPGKWTIH